MTLYLGKNPVGVGRIVEKKVAKTKFGASVDAFLGDVDADGNYVAPSKPVEINLAGVKSVPLNGMYYGLARTSIRKLIANDLISLGTYALAYVCYSSEELVEASFDAIEEITENTSCFRYAFFGTKKLTNVSYKKLKKIISDHCFYYAFSSSGYSGDFSDIFPELEEVSGSNALNFMSSNTQYFFPKLKKAIGGTSKSAATCGSVYTQNTVWNLPNATEFTGYVWNASASYAGEIHFAAANQAAIEACEGYSYKWGFQNATIYFDL